MFIAGALANGFLETKWLLVGKGKLLHLFTLA
jgi:hypothetical protein